MASVKLFRVTEFAESIFASPLAHRTSRHPLVVMLLVALWLATAGHWPLWQTLVTQAQAGAASLPMLLALGAELLLFALFWLALTAWRGLMKPAITVLLFWTALGACLMWLLRSSGEAVAVTPGMLLQFLVKKESWGQLLNWQCGVTLLVVAVLPALLIWRRRIRRIPLMQSLLVNTIILIAVYAFLLWVSGTFSHVVPSPLSVMSWLMQLKV